MFGDDDDVEPQFKDVDRYYFEEGEDKPVCFSVLPLQFGENDEMAYCDSKKVDLRGLADGDLYKVYKKVVAWRVGLDSEQPKISVLSSEGNWIELLKPRKCYEKIVQSILITVQMLHFVRRQPREHKRSLFNHLHAVFNKFDIKPAEDDLRKHHPLIKLFAERDPTLMKSKILQRFLKDTSVKIKKPKKSTATYEPFIVGAESLASSNDDGSDFDDEDDNSEDDDTDNDGDGGDGTDSVCAICDNGGKLLGCEGRCKRSFHPREEDGRESNCDTLGYTSAKLREKEIGTYLCKNCEYKQHQCFKCGELEQSDGPNAKVFQCNNASCGHFYHPKCVAKLLEPDDTDGACELEKRIVAGMSFTCPVHWCCECKRMEDRTKRALKFAVCRRCPRSYHRKCLPSEISLKKKRGTSIRAWYLSKRIIIYCKHHDIDAAIGTPRRDHIKVPSIPEIDQTRDLAKKIVKVLDTPFVDKDAELDDESFRAGKDKDASEREETSGQYSGKEIGIYTKDTVHANQGQEDELVILFAEKHAEGDEKNFNSGKDRETHSGENAYGHDSISGQEKEISRRENRMGVSTYEHDSRSGKEKIPRNESNEFGSSNKGMTPDHVDDLPPERQVQVAHVEKTATTNRIGTHQECGCDGDKEDGSYACQQEPKSPQCNDNIKATEIGTSSDKSRKRRGPKEKATDGKRMDLDRNRKNVHVKNGRDARYEDERTAHPQVHNSPQRLGYKFRNNDLNSPRRSDDRRAAEASEYKSRERRGSKRRKESRTSMGANLYRDNSPMGRSARKRSRDYSPEGQRMDYRANYRRTNGERHIDYSHDGDVDRKRRSPHLSAFSPADFGTSARCSPSVYSRRPEHGTGGRHSSPLRRLEHGTSGRRGPPLYPRRPEHGTRGRRGPFLYLRRPEHVDYAIDRDVVTGHSNSPGFEYDEYRGFDYGGYHAMDTVPVRYSLQENYNDAYGPQTDVSMWEYAEEYGGRSDYRIGSGYPQKNGFNWESRNLAAVSVMDRYAPRLDETNHPIRDRSGLRYALPPVRRQQDLYY